MDNQLALETLKTVFLAITIILLVYLIRDKFNWKIGTLLSIIAFYAFPKTELFPNNQEFSIFTLIHTVIYVITVIISILIIDNYRKKK